MNARWKFRTVDHEFIRRTIRSGRQPLELVGTEHEALSLAAKLVHEQIASGAIQRIQVESVGPVTVPGETVTDRVLCTIRQRHDCRGWMIEPNELQHLCWQSSLIDALSYGAFRTRGKLAEFRVHDSLGKLIQVVIVDQRKWEDGLKFPNAAENNPAGIGACRSRECVLRR